MNKTDINKTKQIPISRSNFINIPKNLILDECRSHDVIASSYSCIINLEIQYQPINLP